MGKQHIIELNGQRYDALTGAIITPTPVPATKKSTTQPIVRNMDGFSRVHKKTVRHHQTEKSKTLMRTGVKKPKQPAPAANPIISTPSKTTITSKHTRNIHKSPLVSRFGKHAVSAPNTSNKPEPQTPVREHVPPPHSTITNALVHATTHTQPKIKKPHLNQRIARKFRVSPKIINGVSFAFAFLIISGFIAYQNVPGMTMRLASSRSGVQGTLPGYQPAGFSINGSIAYKPGQITVNYKSNSDNRNFQVSQSASEWDSQSLLDNFVATDRRDYQTVQDKGKTVYIYDQDNATWVDGGIWYRVEGESNLSSDQLLHIAASM